MIIIYNRELSKGKLGNFEQEFIGRQVVIKSGTDRCYVKFIIVGL